MPSQLKTLPATASSEPEELELTEEETEAVLRKARQAKAQKVKTDNYFKRVLAPAEPWTPERLGNWIIQESKRFDPQNLNIRYTGPDGFVLDEHSQDIFDLMCMYFTRHPDFERIGQLYPQFEKQKFSLNKGLALIGPTGCGKTRLFKLFCDNPRESYLITKCALAVENYKNAPTSAQAGQLITTLSNKSDVYGGKFQQGQGGRMFDDLGVETIPATNFKEPINLMYTVLDKRYDLQPYHAGTTHISTNLTADQIENLYGARMRSRFREMFNLIAFHPKTPDRR